MPRGPTAPIGSLQVKFDSHTLSSPTILAINLLWCRNAGRSLRRKRSVSWRSGGSRDLLQSVVGIQQQRRRQRQRSRHKESFTHTLRCAGKTLLVFLLPQRVVQLATTTSRIAQQRAMCERRRWNTRSCYLSRSNAQHMWTALKASFEYNVNWTELN